MDSVRVSHAVTMVRVRQPGGVEAGAAAWGINSVGQIGAMIHSKPSGSRDRAVVSLVV